MWGNFLDKIQNGASGALQSSQNGARDLGAQNGALNEIQARNAQNNLLDFIYFLPLAIMPFSPFYSYIACVFIMVGLSRFIKPHYRYMLSFTLVLNIAFLYGSKMYFLATINGDDDFTRFYQNYLDIYDGINGAMSVWGGVMR